MKINEINSGNVYLPNFKARFLKSDDLYNIANYASQSPARLKKLLNAKNEICKYNILVRLKLELFEADNGKPFIIFTRYTPKKDAKVIKMADDYIKSEPIIIQSGKKMNALKFGYQTIIKMGNSAPNNNLYKKVVTEKVKVL